MKRIAENRGWFKCCNVVYWLALSIWMAAIFSAGVAAMGVFGVLPSAGVRSDRLSAFADDSVTQGRILGGQIMEPIFTATDLVQIACAVIVVIALLSQISVFRMSWRSPANLIRCVCILAAAILVAIHMVSFAPRMNRELRQSWMEAEAGNLERWQEHRALFERDHVIANRLFNVRFILLLVGIAASAAALTPHVAADDLRRAPN